MKTTFSLLIAVILLVLAGFSGRAELEPASPYTNESSDIIISVDEWDVPFDNRWSRDPHVAPDGTIYFVGQWTHYVGWFDPESEEFGHHDLEDGTGPHTVAVSDDGTIWFTGYSSDLIGKIDASTGELTKFMMDEGHRRGPHTVAFDRDGNFWFTAHKGNGVGHFNVTTGEARIIPVPTGNAAPYGIVMDPAMERPWIALFGTNKLATVDPETMELEEIELPREEIRPRRLNVTSDGNVWYGDYAGGIIGRYNPVDGSITEWEMPHGAGSRPYAVLTDDKDRLWVSATGLDPNSLVAFDTRTEEFVATQEIESARGAIRNMDFDAGTRSIWFGTDTGHIGRVVID